MAQEDFNIREKTTDEKMRRAAVYVICSMILILTVLLDIYFISEILG
jgi:hypothetical protein